MSSSSSTEATSNPPIEIHPNITCDGCTINPFTGPRFHCHVAGCDFDLCYTCYKNKGMVSKHPKEHYAFMVEVKSQPVSKSIIPPSVAFSFPSSLSSSSSMTPSISTSTVSSPSLITKSIEDMNKEELQMVLRQLVKTCLLACVGCKTPCWNFQQDAAWSINSITKEKKGPYCSDICVSTPHCFKCGTKGAATASSTGGKTFNGINEFGRPSYYNSPSTTRVDGPLIKQSDGTYECRQCVHNRSSHAF